MTEREERDFLVLFFGKIFSGGFKRLSSIKIKVGDMRFYIKNSPLIVEWIDSLRKKVYYNKNKNENKS